MVLLLYNCLLIAFNCCAETSFTEMYGHGYFGVLVRRNSILISSWPVTGAHGQSVMSLDSSSVSSVLCSVVDQKISVQKELSDVTSYADWSGWSIPKSKLKINVNEWCMTVCSMTRSKVKVKVMSPSIRKFGHFQRLSSPPFIMVAGKWPRILTLGRNTSSLLGPDFRLLT